LTDEKPAEAPKKTEAKSPNLWQKGDPDLRVNLIAESVQDKSFKADASLRVEIKKEDKKKSD
jgi:hypothetical protein